MAEEEKDNNVEVESSNESEESSSLENIDISYSLKVLNGPHAGAELSLSEKTWIVGRSETCDVALLDETLNEQHAKFSLKEGKVFCEPFEGATVTVDGFTLEGPTELRNYQSILCGKTLLSVGPSNEAWPEISLKEVKVEEQEESKKELVEEVKESSKAATYLKYLKKWKENRWLLKTCLFLGFAFLGIFSLFRSNNNEISETEKKSFPIVSLKASIPSIPNIS